MTGRSEWFDDLATRAATRMSRRQATKVAAAGALALLAPTGAGDGGLFESVARAADRTTRQAGGDFCPAVPAGTCPQTPTAWSASCAHPIPSGAPVMFNGCGPQNGVDVGRLGRHDLVPDRPLNVGDFTEPCIWHDCCYGGCGNAKDSCDSGFGDRMRAVCRDTWLSGSVVSGALGAVAALAQCYAVARWYEFAVHQWGQDAYAAGQGGACLCCDQDSQTPPPSNSTPPATGPCPPDNPRTGYYQCCDSRCGVPPCPPSIVCPNH